MWIEGTEELLDEGSATMRRVWGAVRDTVERDAAEALPAGISTEVGAGSAGMVEA
ncbi:hypothetical protein [Nocardia carnea]|uniref:hypothetical protein n=1 Tax=Nocardia carnea TaxID=37328 RepID=UPI002458CEBC|nr:hypothetical protein [Nocardia carnea]